MRVSVRFFASHRERVGRDRLEFELAPGASVADLIGRVVEGYPELEPTLRVARFAVNREYAPPSTVLRDGDEVAFIPPVAGGSKANHHGPASEKN